MHSMSDPIIPAPCMVRSTQPAWRSLASRCLSPRPVEASAAEATRLRVGDIQAVYRPFPAQRTIALTPSDSQIHVVLPALGTAVAVTADDTYEIGAGEALLLARVECVSCVWQAGSAGLVLQMPRAAIQAEATRLFEEPRRLAGIVSVFEWRDRPSLLAGPPFDAGLLDNRLDQDEAIERQRALCVSLVRAVAAASLGRSAFPVAKSVLRALTHVRANPHGAWTVEDLAPVAGVTAATLRKNFRTCLDQTVTQVVREARLAWVRQQLGSPHESRSIARLAEAAGFSGAGVLARAYQQHFGETPTQTRTHAFKNMRA